MTHFPWTLKGLLVSVAVVTLVGVAAAISIGLAYPEPVSSGALGPDWQCTRLALVFTSCTRLVRAEQSAAVPVAGARDSLATHASKGCICDARCAKVSHLPRNDPACGINETESARP